MHQPSKLPIAGSSPAVPVGNFMFPYSPIAQLAEYLTVNQSVPGSSPGGGACPCSSAGRARLL